MQFVRSHLILGFLGNLAIVVGWQEFRRDGRIDYVEQYAAEVFAKHILSRIADEVTYEGLRNTCVDAIHRHLVAAIGAPAQCQFAQVACADHDTIEFVSQIHEDKRADTCLRILVGDVVIVHIMGYVVQVLGSNVADANLAVGDAQLFHEFQCIAVGAVTGTKARHSDAHYLLAVITETIGCLNADEQSQRAV